MPRTNTRDRIQQTALKLFAEQGYDRTSLREIADDLQMTKAALYYHFKAKEDILAAVAEEQLKPIEDAIAWAQAQPSSLDARREALRRYATALSRAEPLLRVFEENQAALCGLSFGTAYCELRERGLACFYAPEGELPNQLRSVLAALVVQKVPYALDGMEGSPEAKRAAVLEVALDLLTLGCRF
ncbi:TetR/AcrR family transcriptional regulator [Streptomyces coelicoflavus]|uniref:TetR/AcrR family transcriptional regulator n=1 Tax=Streptomyces coelicoflavus TaxID=285562 RepID=UPI00369DF008